MSTFHPFGATTYNLSGSISSTATSIVLSSFLEPVTGTPYTMALLNTDIAYGTIAPKTTSSEFISFTSIVQNANGTATLGGVTRGLAKKYPFTTSSSYKLPHSGQTQFIISDAPQVFEKYPTKENAETVAGDWTFTGNVTFSNFPVTPSNSDASTTVKGVSKLSTAPLLSTNPIAVGTNDNRIPIGYAVDSVGTDAYAINPTLALVAYAAGQIFTFQAGTANTGAATLNVSGLGAKTIKKNVSTDLATGDILLNQIVMVEYDGTNMQLLSLIPQGAIILTSQVSGVLPVANGGTGLVTKNFNSGAQAGATTSTTVIAHGLGKTPAHVKITAMSSVGLGNQGSIWSVGTYDGVTNQCIYMNQTTPGSGQIVGAPDTSNTIRLSVGSGNQITSGTVALDATNITITWSSVNGGIANYLLWEAFGI